MDPITTYLTKCGIGWKKDTESVNLQEMMEWEEFRKLANEAKENSGKRIELGKMLMENLFFLKGEAYITDKKTFIQRFGLHKNFEKIPDELFRTIKFSPRGTQQMLCGELNQEKFEQLINDESNEHLWEQIEPAYNLKKLFNRTEAYRQLKETVVNTAYRLESDIQLAMILKSEQLNKEIGTLLTYYYFSKTEV